MTINFNMRDNYGNQSFGDNAEQNNTNNIRIEQVRETIDEALNDVEVAKNTELSNQLKELKSLAEKYQESQSKSVLDEAENLLTKVNTAAEGIPRVAGVITFATKAVAAFFGIPPLM